MTDLNIRLLGDRVLILPDEPEAKTKAGLFVPESAKKDLPKRGTVLVVGGLKERYLEVVPGDKVLYSKYAGTEVSLDGKDYLILRETDVIGILDETVGIEKPITEVNTRKVPADPYAQSDENKAGSSL